MSGHQIAKIFIGKNYDGEYYILEEKAFGEPIHNKNTRFYGCRRTLLETAEDNFNAYMNAINKYLMRMSQIADLSDKKIYDYVRTAEMLYYDDECLLTIDTIGDNIMFSPEKGFTFMDIGKKPRSSMPVPNIFDKIFDISYPNRCEVLRDYSITIAESNKIVLGNKGDGVAIDSIPEEFYVNIGSIYQRIVDKLYNFCENDILLNDFNRTVKDINNSMNIWATRVKPTDQILYEIIQARMKVKSKDLTDDEDAR